MARELLEYFNERCQIQQDGCIYWIGTLSKRGYGDVHKNKIGRVYGVTSAHRLAYLLHYGTIPNDKIICHKCNVPKCVNIEHLYAGSLSDNLNDCYRANRRRSFKGENHPYAKLTERDVLEIRDLRTYGYSCAWIAPYYNVCNGTIKDIHTKKSWGWL